MRGPLQLLRDHWRKFAMVAALLAVLIAVSNFWIVASSRSYVYRDVSAVPTNEVGLVLGTSRALRGGRPNPHFDTRIAAAAALYRAGKIKRLLLSGDNRRPDYDEPTDMKNALLARGIPESAMTLDYAGLRTLDSMVRARTVFGQTRLTIITEDFHAPRAVFLARRQGIEAVAFSAEPVPMRFSLRSQTREIGARVKAVLDVYVLHTGPKFAR